MELIPLVEKHLSETYQEKLKEWVLHVPFVGTCISWLFVLFIVLGLWTMICTWVRCLQRFFGIVSNDGCTRKRRNICKNH